MSIGQLPVRHYEYKNPSGKFIVCGVPKGCPPHFEAILHLEQAVANNHEFIRLEYGSLAGKEAPRVVEYRVDWLYKQAKRYGLLRNRLGMAPSQDGTNRPQRRFECWQGATFPVKGDSS